MAKLNEMVKEFRLSINQSPEAFAMMLQITPEEYEKLEVDWIPPDDLLKSMCALFEWNFSDIQIIARNTPEAAISKQRVASAEKPAVDQLTPKEPSSFKKMLREARMEVNQTTEVVAMFLHISQDYYETFENSAIPPDDLLRKICSLFSWNYRDTKQQLINRATPRMGGISKPIPLEEARINLLNVPSQVLNVPSKPDTLATRLVDERKEMEQSVEALALMLNINPDYYIELESGRTPEPELLKHIAALFRWNYNEILLLVYNENIQSFQPTVTRLDSSSGKTDQKLQMIQNEIKSQWKKLNSQQKDMLISQLEVLRDTVKRWMS